MKITHEKNLEVYRFRNVSPTHDWADIYIDVDNNSEKQGGAISIRSDFGSWDYYWGSPGKPFKKFLSEIGTDYLIGKLSHGQKEFSIERWEKNAREIIKENLQDDESQLKYMLEELEVFLNENHFTSSEVLFEVLSRDYDEIFNIFNETASFPTGESIPRQLEMFVEQVWPSFVEELKKENS